MKQVPEHEIAGDFHRYFCRNKNCERCAQIEAEWRETYQVQIGQAELEMEG